MNPVVEESDPNLHIAVMLDFAATRYNILPSEFLRKADSLDMYVMDLAVTYQKYQMEKTQSKNEGKAPPIPKLSIEEMKKMMEKVKK